MGCGRCLATCPTDAIVPVSWDAGAVFNRKMAEYAAAIVAGKPQFHVSLIVDVSPNCDCHAENDIPIVPDVGMLCSEDMVALDQACADLVNAAEPIKGSQLDKNLKKIANKVAKKLFYDYNSRIRLGELFGPWGKNRFRQPGI